MKNLVAPRWISGHFQFVDLWRQIRDVAAINPESLAETTLPDLEFDYVDLAAVDEGTIASVLVSHRFESAPSRARRITQEGDLLVATVRPLLDGHTRVPKQGFRQLIASTGYAVLRIKDPNERDLVWHLLTSRLVRRQFHAKVAGSSYPAIAESDVGEIWIPKFKEHLVYRVVRACNALQSSESILNRLIAAKREQKRGLMQQLLTGKLRFPGFTEPWAARRIGDVLEECARPTECDDDRVYRLVSIRRRNGGLFMRAELAGSKILTKSLFVIRRGDLLISCRQVVHGAIAIVPASLDTSYVSGEYLCLVPRSNKLINTDFVNLLAHLPAMRKLTMSCSNGVHIEKLNLDVKKFLRCELFMPPNIDEQLELVEVFEAIDSEINLLEQQRAAFAAQRRGLMEKLLSGEIDIQNPKETAA